MMRDTAFAEKLYTKKYIEKIKNKVLLLGSKSKINPIEFMHIRTILCFIVFFVILLFSKRAYIYAPVGTLVVYKFLEYFILDLKIKTRASKLDYEALFFFEVLTLSLETGRNLKGALELTSNTINGELSDEFKEALKEMTFGKTLNEALENLKRRIPSESINNVILNINQSNIFGSSILETLYNQVDYLRDKKILEARAVITKMPLKISIVSVLFFIPIIILLIVSPIVLDLLT